MIDMKTVHCFLLGIFLAATAAAQPIYETQDKDGPVFSDLPSQGRDVPSPGATELALPPINVSDPPPAAPPAESAPAPTAAPYQSLSISQPAGGGTIHSNTGQFTVQVALDPALRVARGDVLVVSLDGQELTAKRTTTHFDISPAEWQMAAVDSVEHQLQIAVVDRSGVVLIGSEPVRFYAHRATRGR
ncbi:MAG: hypothetical protein KDI64_20130 [Candidatus Accumulibacter sp.]|nr:hypothetical protein [Accumulibacter sp.]